MKRGVIMAKGKYDYEYVKRYFEKYGYTLLEEVYLNSSQKLRSLCPKGHEYFVEFRNFKHKGTRCPICNPSGRAKLKIEDVRAFIESEGFKLLSDEYKNNSTKLDIECPEGHTHSMTFGNFQRGRRCPHCSNIAKHDYEYVKEYIESFGYKLISKEYLGNHKHLEVECEKGHRYSVAFAHFKNGKRCPYCQGVAKYSIDDVIAYTNETNIIYVSGTYKDIDSKLNFKCDKGHEFKTSFRIVKRGCVCPACNVSKGEEMIANVLDKYNIEYIREHRFPDCKYKSMLPFDFYLPKANRCIEFDGVQHFEPVSFFGGKRAFEKTKLRDEIKTNYCKDTGIGLTRIPYWDFDNIEEILINELEL